MEFFLVFLAFFLILILSPSISLQITIPHREIELIIGKIISITPIKIISSTSSEIISSSISPTTSEVISSTPSEIISSTPSEIVSSSTSECICYQIINAITGQVQPTPCPIGSTGQPLPCGSCYQLYGSLAVQRACP